jgi:cytochrome c
MNAAQLIALVGGLALGGQALASAKLAEEKQCMQCHAASQPPIGPTFEQIRAQWKGKKDAEAKLVAVISRGSDATGGPHWGKAKMPNDAERPMVSDAEAKKIVKWILAGK